MFKVIEERLWPAKQKAAKGKKNALEHCGGTQEEQRDGTVTKLKGTRVWQKDHLSWLVCPCQFKANWFGLSTCRPAPLSTACYCSYGEKYLVFSTSHGLLSFNNGFNFSGDKEFPLWNLMQTSLKRKEKSFKEFNACLAFTLEHFNEICLHLHTFTVLFAN